MSEQAQFKSRFFAVLKDLQENGIKDGQTMWLLGSLASDLSDDLGGTRWSDAKARINPPTFEALLRAFRDQGNQHHREGRNQHAYAVQALTVSLMASALREDPQLVEGERLIDAVIDAAVTAYRRDRTAPPPAD